jgi:hypothetical protein
MLRRMQFRNISLTLAMAAYACLPSTCAEVDSAAKTLPVPSISLPLESFGYRPKLNEMALRAGYTSATVAFIDNDYVLLTFSARILMKRSPDQREGDDDHAVRAEVIHLPDGKVVRETEWRMHDRAPYIWSLGNGKFLLRERGDLYTVDPLRGDTKTIGRTRLFHSEDDIETIQFSPSHDLVLVETSPARKIGDDPDEKRDRPVSAKFYRIATDDTGNVRLISRGEAVARDAFSIAFTSTGVLQTVREDRTHWGFDFHPFVGKNIELAGFTSTCRPRSIFISDAEFFAYGCRGGEDRRLLGGFNLLAEAKWVFTLDDPPLWLAVDAAPANGRFAVRSTLTTTTVQEGDRLGNSEIRGEEVRVYGSREGEELLRVVTSPAQRPGGNFALSPDGLKLAVLAETNLQVYSLPPISAADRKLHEREQAALQGLKAAASANIAAFLSRPDDSPSNP